MGVDRLNADSKCGFGGAIVVRELESDEDFVDYVQSHVDIENFVTVETENLSGNINRVRRLRFHSKTGNCQSYVVKHVPRGGQLERYPTIVFPDNRLTFEAEWFHFAKSTAQSHRVKTPNIIHFGNDGHTLIMEDLKPRMTLGEYCHEGQDLKTVLTELGSFLVQIHRASIGAAVVPNNPTASLNRPFAFSKPVTEPEAMRNLWRARQLSEDDFSNTGISLPEQIELQDGYLSKNAVRLLPVLKGLESSFKQSADLVLTHGDLHTASVLILENGAIALIDAELCDYGTAGYDLGVLCAHIWAELASAHTDKEMILNTLACLLSGYAPNDLIQKQVDCAWLLNLLQSTTLHCGAELLRRLLGAAGFNVRLTLSQRQFLLETATELLLDPKEFCQQWASALVLCR